LLSPGVIKNDADGVAGILQSVSCRRVMEYAYKETR